jgi:O-antigen/teichoic acid export membrane protein
MFTVALSLTTLATQGTLIFGGALMSHFAGLIGTGDVTGTKKAYATATRLTALLVFPCCFGCAAVTPVLLPSLYGERFAPAIPSAILLLLFAAFTTSAMAGSAAVYAHERSAFIFWGGLLGALLSLGAGFLIIPTFGVLGAVWARGFTQFTMVALGSWYVIHQLRMAAPLKALGKTVLAALACAAVAHTTLQIRPLATFLPVAILSGALTYLLLVRILYLVADEDRQALARMLKSLPGFSR